MRMANVPEPSRAVEPKPVRSMSSLKVVPDPVGSESNPMVPNVAALLKRSKRYAAGLCLVFR